jgi:hypothetical protein
MYTSAPFRVGYFPVQRVMNFPCLSAAGIRFLYCPSPTEELAVPYGSVTDCSDLIGVSLFRIRKKRAG